MSAGCPVICSNIETFREVAGNAALFFDPNYPKELAKQVIRLENPIFRSRVVERSKKRAKSFSWQKSADKLESFLLSLLEGEKN